MNIINDIITQDILLFFVSLTLIYKVTKLTTIGKHEWFGDLIDKVNNDKIRDFLIKISYNKALICRPCHTFWLSLFTNLALLPMMKATIMSFAAYIIVNYFYKDENETNETDESDESTEFDEQFEGREV